MFLFQPHFSNKHYKYSMNQQYVISHMIHLQSSNCWMFYLQSSFCANFIMSQWVQLIDVDHEFHSDFRHDNLSICKSFALRLMTGWTTISLSLNVMTGSFTFILGNLTTLSYSFCICVKVPMSKFTWSCSSFDVLVWLTVFFSFFPYSTSDNSFSLTLDTHW